MSDNISAEQLRLLIERIERMLKTIRNNRILVQLPVGIDNQGELIRIPKGFFVPKDQVRAIDPPAQQGVNGKPKTQAELDAERRAQEIRREAARLVVGPLKDTPLAGRSFWPAHGYGISPFRDTEHPDLGKGVYVALQIFVPDVEIDARLADGEQLLDQRKAAEEAARTEKERLAAEKKAAEQARWDELLALDPPPEVLLDVDGNAWVKTADGWTVEGEEEEVGSAFHFADLLAQMVASDVQAWWQTRAEYEASRAPATADQAGAA